VRSDKISHIKPRRPNLSNQTSPIKLRRSSLSIGVFDSGVGGLTVLKELARLVPHADYLYFGDTARLPYGSKSVETVAKYAISSAHFLQQRGIDLLVVACNTATALAFEQIKAAVSVPVIGVIEPGANRAASASRSQSVAVIATEATVASHAYQRALAQRGVRSREIACPLLVPLVEEGWLDHAVTEQVARIYLAQVFDGVRAASVASASAEKSTGKQSQPASATVAANPADVLLLGCTHYPLLRPLLERITPPGVTIVDSAESTAQAVADHLRGPAARSTPAAGSASAVASAALANQHFQSPDHPIAQSPKPAIHFFATDSVEKFRRSGERFIGHAIQNVEHVDIEV